MSGSPARQEPQASQRSSLCTLKVSPRAEGQQARGGVSHLHCLVRPYRLLCLTSWSRWHRPPTHSQTRQGHPTCAQEGCVPFSSRSHLPITSLVTLLLAQTPPGTPGIKPQLPSTSDKLAGSVPPSALPRRPCALACGSHAAPRCSFQQTPRVPGFLPRCLMAASLLPSLGSPTHLCSVNFTLGGMSCLMHPKPLSPPGCERYTWQHICPALAIWVCPHVSPSRQYTGLIHTRYLLLIPTVRAVERAGDEKTMQEERLPTCRKASLSCKDYILLVTHH